MWIHNYAIVLVSPFNNNKAYHPYFMQYKSMLEKYVDTTMNATCIKMINFNNHKASLLTVVSIIGLLTGILLFNIRHAY